LGAIPQSREAVATLEANEYDIANSPKSHENECDDDDDIKSGLPLGHTKDATVKEQEAAFHATKSECVENVSRHGNLCHWLSVSLNGGKKRVGILQFEFLDETSSLLPLELQSWNIPRLLE
jgi:hypothetical protein